MAITAKLRRRTQEVTTLVPESQNVRVTLRIPSTDTGTFEKVFVDEEYAFQPSRAPEYIIDAGANIGCASVYYALCFPHAKIIALEPEYENFLQLKRNVAPYPNVEPVYGALWNQNTRLRLFGGDKGQNAFRVEAESENLNGVEGYTVTRLMEERGWPSVDVLKLDIVGAEKEVLECSDEWIEKVECIVVELHDRIKDGCSEAYEAIAEGFSKRWLRGENHFISK